MVSIVSLFIASPWAPSSRAGFDVRPCWRLGLAVARFHGPNKHADAALHVVARTTHVGSSETAMGPLSLFVQT